MTTVAALKIILACQPDAGDAHNHTNWSIVALWEESYPNRAFPTKTYDCFGIQTSEKDIKQAKDIMFWDAMHQLAARVDRS